MSDVYHLEQLGTVRCAAKTVAEVPSEGIPSRVELRKKYLDAMLGVEVGDFLYVVTIFHLADSAIHQGSSGTENA